MTLDELTRILTNLAPGKEAAVSYDLYADLFPPGEPDQNAREACYRFAKSVGCSIRNRAEEQTVWFVKDRNSS
jgi:hypothetical protein